MTGRILISPGRHRASKRCTRARAHVVFQIPAPSRYWFTFLSFLLPHFTFDSPLYLPPFLLPPSFPPSLAFTAHPSLHPSTIPSIRHSLSPCRQTACLRTRWFVSGAELVLSRSAPVHHDAQHAEHRALNTRQTVFFNTKLVDTVNQHNVYDGNHIGKGNVSVVRALAARRIAGRR